MVYDHIEKLYDFMSVHNKIIDSSFFHAEVFKNTVMDTQSSYFSYSKVQELLIKDFLTIMIFKNFEKVALIDSIFKVFNFLVLPDTNIFKRILAL